MRMGQKQLEDKLFLLRLIRLDSGTLPAHTLFKPSIKPSNAHTGACSGMTSLKMLINANVYPSVVCR